MRVNIGWVGYQEGMIHIPFKGGGFEGRRDRVLLAGYVVPGLRVKWIIRKI